ncbi:MAG: RyR domain-containing protein [Thermodesulfobacteriota bacterium]
MADQEPAPYQIHSTWQQERKTKERFLEFWDDYSWVVIGILWVVVLVSGFLGFAQYLKPKEDWTPNALDMLYRTFQLIVLESGSIEGHAGWPFEVARFLAPPLAALTALKAFTTILRDKLRLVWLKWFGKNHAIICGLGRKGMRFATGLLEFRQLVVVVEKDENNEYVRKCKERGGIVLIGDARDRSMMERARLDKAQALICACGLDETNAEIALGVRNRAALGKTQNHLLAMVHVFSPHMCNLLGPLRQQMALSAGLRMEWFSIFQNGAWTMLSSFPPFPEEPSEQGPHPHMCVVGIGWLGQSIVIQAAKKWKRHHAVCGKSLEVTVIDKEAARITGYLCSKYPGLEDVCAFRTIDVDVQSREFEDAAFLSDNPENHAINSIYVCIDHPTLGLEAALSLAARTYDRGIPVVTRVDDEQGIAALLKVAARESDVYRHLFPFPLIDETCRPHIYIQWDRDHMTASYHGTVMIERLARLFHAAYVREQTAVGRKLGETPALVGWDDLSEEYKEQNREQARNLYGLILLPLRFGVTPLTEWEPEPFVFTEDELEQLARREHDRWLKSKLSAGWTYGSVRDDAKKINPNICSYDQLDDATKTYNKEFFRKLPETLAAADYEIYRVSR